MGSVNWIPRHTEICGRCECRECGFMSHVDYSCNSPAHIAKGYCRCACIGCRGKTKKAIKDCYFRMKGRGMDNVQR